MKKSNKIILGLILLLAFALRIWNISKVPVSLFGDELDVGYHAYSILKTGKDYQGNFMPLHFHSIAEWRTPLYLYTSVPTVALFGISPLGVRLPAVIFGVLGVLGIFFLIKEILSYNSIPSTNHPRALLAAFLLAISPWHLQYSRAGFEVTMLLAFLIFGLYFFLMSIRVSGKYLWLSVLFLTFTPWIYSTAKLFTPLLMIFLTILWWKKILTFSKKYLAIALVVGLILGLPIAYSTVYGGGAERATYTSIFTDPTVIPDIGAERMSDLFVRGTVVLGSKPTISDRLFHNKFVVWGNTILRNYLETFSFSFLFNRGDPNLRHSPDKMGEFYAVEVFAIIFGVYFFFSSQVNKKIKLLLLFWIIIGALPASLTRDGGNHATRLILILPALIFLLSYGLVMLTRSITTKWKYIFIVTYSFLLAINFTSYLHNYYKHYPWKSERWWHAGFGEAISSIKDIDESYDKVIISMAGEPAWIFFPAWYEYPPDKWQRDFPIGKDVELNGFGKISHIDKFYFGNFNVAGEGLYSLGKYIDNKTLYLAVAKEFPPNLILEPERLPGDLKLIKAIAYPSGEPAYYLFTKN